MDDSTVVMWLIVKNDQRLLSNIICTDDTFSENLDHLLLSGDIKARCIFHKF